MCALIDVSAALTRNKALVSGLTWAGEGAMAVGAHGVDTAVGQGGVREPDT